MQLSLFVIAFAMTLIMPLTGYAAEVPQIKLSLNESFIVFNDSPLNPSVLIRIPFSDMHFEIQTRNELKTPLGRYVDAKIPLNYHLTKSLLFHLNGTMERIYLMQTPSEIVSGNGWGIPLNTMYGSVQTQQVVIEFGLTFGF